MGVATSKPGSRDRAIENAMRLLGAGEVSIKSFKPWHFLNEIKSKATMIGKSCGNAKEVERQKSPRVGVGYLQVGLVYMLDADTGSVQPQMRQSVSSLTTLPAACLSSSSWKTCQGRTIEGRIYGDEMTCHPLSPLLREPRRRIRKKRGSVPFRKYLLPSQNVTFSW